jgi:hypothetical protein
MTHCETCTCYHFIQTFLDTLAPDEGKTIKATELWQAYLDWAAPRRHPHLSQNKFSRLVSAAGVPRAYLGAQGYAWVGYRLVS